MGTTSLGVVAVHYNDPGAVAALLANIRSWSLRPSSIVIVDNSSSLVLDPAAHDLPVLVVEPGSNLGYAGAINIGVARMPEDVDRVVLATQDADCRPDAVAKLDAALASTPSAGVVAPLLAYGSSADLVFSAGGVISRQGRLRPLGRLDPVTRWLAAGIRPVEWADGALLLVRRTAFDAAGGFDEDFFLYVEEVDFLFRLRSLGWKVLVCSDAVASQNPGRFLTYLKYRNTYHFTRKHQAEVRRWAWWLDLGIDSVRGLLQGTPSTPVWAILGLVDARRGRLGPPTARKLRSPVMPSGRRR